MNKTLDDTIESVADLAGVYGICDKNNPMCGQIDHCCRSNFVASIHERISAEIITIFNDAIKKAMEQNK